MLYNFKNLIFIIFFFLLSCKTTKKEKPFKNFAIVSAKIEASKAGHKILKMGGNAFDAMIATDLALAVVYPNAGNLGGGGFMVYRQKSGENGSLDFREKAPINAYKNMYLNDDGNVVKNSSNEGALSIGIPGTIAGLFEVYKKFGTLPIDSLFEPALSLAKNGFPLTNKQAKLFNLNKNKILKNSDSINLFKKDFKTDMIFKNKPLYNTLKYILKNGKDGFYKGKISDEIISYTSKKGGLLTKDDFLLYNPVWRKPFVFHFDDLKIITMGLPSSGGVVLSQILKSLELLSLDKFKNRDLNYTKTLIELQKNSFADRSKFLGDPDFYHTGFVDSLVGLKYLNERLNSINFINPKPSSQINPGDIVFNESYETTHYSILDSYGNAVSVTTTLNSNFGSKIIVPSLGFFLNNEMDDFSIKPGEPNIYGLIVGKVNSIEPQKRMLSSMTPTIIEKDGKLSMILGSPGGPTIITSVLQTILNVYLFGDNINESVNHPRFYHLWLPDKIYLEKGAFDSQTVDSLKSLGYVINKKFSSIGRVDAIYIDKTNKIFTAADPRGDDYSLGE
jgi:gamma-glutamyltranspeptidase/glutathione hydrolase